MDLNVLKSNFIYNSLVLLFVGETVGLTGFCWGSILLRVGLPLGAWILLFFTVGSSG